MKTCCLLPLCCCSGSSCARWSLCPCICRQVLRRPTGRWQHGSHHILRRFSGVAGLRQGAIPSQINLTPESLDQALESSLISPESSGSCVISIGGAACRPPRPHGDQDPCTDTNVQHEVKDRSELLWRLLLQKLQAVRSAVARIEAQPPAAGASSAVTSNSHRTRMNGSYTIGVRCHPMVVTALLFVNSAILHADVLLVRCMSDAAKRSRFLQNRELHISAGIVSVLSRVVVPSTKHESAKTLPHTSLALLQNLPHGSRRRRPPWQECLQPSGLLLLRVQKTQLCRSRRASWEIQSMLVGVDC